MKSLRNNELLKDYRCCLAEELSTGSYTGREDMIRRMLVKCQPKYDVSFDYALRVMYAMLRDGKPCPAKGSCKREMWEEIMRHTERIVGKRGCSIADALATVLAEKRASRYFLSYKQASKIIYHERKTAAPAFPCRA